MPCESTRYVCCGRIDYVILVTVEECIPRRRFEPRDRRRAGGAHRGSDRGGARRWGSAAGVRVRATPAGREPRHPAGSVAGFAARRCCVRLAAAHEEESDFGGGG